MPKSWTELRQHYAGRKVLITGHTGFIGSWLTALLTELGAEVDGLSLDEPQPLLKHKRSVMREWRVDIRDHRAVKSSCDTERWSLVIHLAAQSLLPVAQRHPLETLRTNVMGTLNLLDALQHSPPELVLIASSDKCYRPKQSPHKEEDPLGGFEPYGASKAAMEIAVKSLQLPFAQAMLRPGNAIGPGDTSAHRLLPDAMTAAHRGQQLKLRTPHSIRPWQHVIELCWAIALLGTHQAAHQEAWNIGPKQSASVQQVLQLLERCWHNSPQQHSSSEFIFPDDPQLRLDCSKLEQALGWSSLLSLEQAVDWTVRGQQALLAGSAVESVMRTQLEQYRNILEHL